MHCSKHSHQRENPAKVSVALFSELSRYTHPSSTRKNSVIAVFFLLVLTSNTPQPLDTKLTSIENGYDNQPSCWELPTSLPCTAHPHIVAAPRVLPPRSSEPGPRTASERRVEPGGKIPFCAPPYNWSSVDCNSPRRTEDDERTNQTPPSATGFTLRHAVPFEPTSQAYPPRFCNSAKKQSPSSTSYDQCPTTCPKRKPQSQRTTPLLFPLLPSRTVHTPISPPRPSPRIHISSQALPMISSFFRPPREADIRACQPREVYVYRVKRGERRHSRPHTPLIQTSFLEDMSRFSPTGTVHHTQRLEVPRTFHISCGSSHTVRVFGCASAPRVSTS